MFQRFPDIMQSDILERKIQEKYADCETEWSNPLPFLHGPSIIWQGALFFHAFSMNPRVSLSLADFFDQDVGRDISLLC